MKAITLINPKGELRELTNVEFFELQLQYAKSSVCKKWSSEKNIALWIRGGIENKETVLSISAINKFLIESGYKIINNLHQHE